MNSDEVPMMFRAQVQNRCQLHLVKKDVQRQDSHKWVDEWKAIFPKSSFPSQATQPSKPAPRQPQHHNPATARIPQNSSALARGAKPGSVTAPQQDATLQIPKFPSGVETRKYTLRWRLVSNCGQDEGVIRPIIGAKGFPYYSGASMKGAFLRACLQMHPKEQTELYCGKKLADGSSKPGILRFHGAYPVDMNWTDRLVDIIHSQQKKQVKEDKQTNANAQISLYQAELRFGISSCKILEPPEWERIWQIWEKALAEGIGSRVSAGYGHFKEITNNNQLLQIKLKGQGIASTLIDKTPEFRPNIFKAALRGHTLRLLGGLTDEVTAEQVTQKLWGGFGDDKKAVVGLLGIDFDFATKDLKDRKPKNRYELESGALNILFMHRDSSDDELRNKLVETAESLVKFSLLLGGFGRSWRRVDHSLFHKSYFDKPSKPMIGCHWEFIDESTSLYHPVNSLNDITNLIDNTRNAIRAWIPSENLVNENIISPSVNQWREPWHPQKVEVWARLAENGKSQAIRWFHEAYNGTDSIRNPHPLTGSMGKTGHIWHRMYPRYITNDKGAVIPGQGYVEFLTIFPLKNSPDTKKFLQFLAKETQFKKVW